MAPTIVHLPNGQNLAITPVFGGLFFKSNDLTHHHSPFPPGWTIVLNSEDEEREEIPQTTTEEETPSTNEEPRVSRRHIVHRYKKPTLQNDHLYISSISNPSSNEFKPASSPTRQIAMMLWATLWWYFHQTEPNLKINSADTAKTAEAGRPEGEWRININREGIFKGKVVLPKLERMGLIASEDSSVGVEQSEKSPEGWTNMFVSRKSFWQLDARIYLFTLSPLAQSPFPSGSPYASRPASPSREGQKQDNTQLDQVSQGLWSPNGPGPFHSTSHLPTYYPPPPPQYIYSNHVRHPIRPKPPRQGEIFYTRFVPSVTQYLSFRVASISSKPLRHKGPVASNPVTNNFRNSQIMSEPTVPTMGMLGLGLSDPEYLHKWMNDPRVSHFWGEAGPQSQQEEFLKKGLQNKNSFPVIGCWDGKPFGYFELYWVKEDNIGKYLGGNVGNYDRGIHCLVGEEEFRGPHRVKIWLSALVHYCWLSDNRTESVIMEPRADNDTLIKYCLEVGFYRERDLSFPHKKASIMKIRRDAWEAPAL